MLHRPTQKEREGEREKERHKDKETVKERKRQRQTEKERQREGEKGRKSPCPDKKCRQAPTGPNTSFGALHVQGRGGRERKTSTDWKVHWCQQV